MKEFIDSNILKEDDSDIINNKINDYNEDKNGSKQNNKKLFNDHKEYKKKQ